MFIRRTITRRVGKTDCQSFRLVHPVREGDRVRQKTLLNPGSAFTVPKPQWRGLVATIDDQLAGTAALSEPDPDLVAVATGIVQKLRRLGYAAPKTPAMGPAEEIVLDSVQCDDARSVGCERLCLEALPVLNLIPILKREGFSSRDARIATALVIARMVHPSSEREAFRWLRTNSAVLELLDLDRAPSFRPDKPYRISDAPQRRQTAIEDALSAQTRTLSDPAGAVIFYDLTNTHLTGSPTSGLAQFGRSKQKRHDCPLVTLALATDSHGFPRRSEVLPGNVTETGTLSDAPDHLNTGDGADGPTVIMDAGICGGDNLEYLREKGYPWITVNRSPLSLAQVAIPEQDPETVVRTRAGYEARIWTLETLADEVRPCLWSEARQQGEAKIIAGRRDRFERELTSLKDGLSKKNHLKSYARVLEKIGQLRERHALVGHHYGIRVTPNAKRQASDISWRHSQAAEHRDMRAGTYILRTSHTDRDLDQVVRTYWRLTEIEASFRSLKPEPGSRPIHHRKTRRIEGHPFIAVLALHGVTLLRCRLKDHQIHDSWTTVRHRPAGWIRVTTAMTNTAGALTEVRVDARPNPEAGAIARAAGVPFRSNLQWRKHLRRPDG